MKIDQDELTAGFFEVFRKVGYDGASLEALASASGLKKSSLYHRFPGGKQEMATEVLKYSASWVSANITNVLREDGAPTKRLTMAMKHVNALYSGGQKACILRALSMDNGLELFSTFINGTLADLIDAFTVIASDLGWSATAAAIEAEDVVIKIQGSLIVSRGMSNEYIFKRTLIDIENRLKSKL
jgi:AcrR family transcriptional regulator